MPELDKGIKLTRMPEFNKGGELAGTPKLLWVFAFTAIVQVVLLPSQLPAMMLGIVVPINLGGFWMTDILSGVTAVANMNAKANATELPVVVLVLPVEGASSPTAKWAITIVPPSWSPLRCCRHPSVQLHCHCDHIGMVAVTSPLVAPPPLKAPAHFHIVS